MKFRTEYRPQPRALRLTPDLPVALVGSCFSDNIGSCFRACGWPAAVNPCGVLFNPVSIHKAVISALENKEPEVTSFGGRWISWDFSTLFGAPTQEECLEKCSVAYQELGKCLNTPGATLIVTFGTAFVYHLQADGRPVANCHKAPAADFMRWLMSPDEIVSLWQPLVQRLMLQGVNVIFTVSPVRHLKDGLDGNSLSKAVLRMAVAEICARTGALYFPAYEIMTDDLRDYRFYAQDMVHPSQLAIDYIWDIFSREFMDADTSSQLDEGAALIRRLQHRMLSPDAEKSEAFRKETERLVDAFRQKCPWFSV